MTEMEGNGKRKEKIFINRDEWFFCAKKNGGQARTTAITYVRRQINEQQSDWRQQQL